MSTPWYGEIFLKATIVQLNFGENVKKKLHIKKHLEEQKIKLLVSILQHRILKLHHKIIQRRLYSNLFHFITKKV